jgi:hypothetical protein
MSGAKTFCIPLMCAGAAMAQYVVGARAGTVRFTIGEVSVDGRPGRATKTNFPSLKEGHAIRTGVHGRLELMLAPGVFLRLAETRLHRTHWQMTSLGWSWDKDFGMQFFSPAVARRFRRASSPGCKSKKQFPPRMFAVKSTYGDGHAEGAAGGALDSNLHFGAACEPSLL